MRGLFFYFLISLCLSPLGAKTTPPAEPNLAVIAAPRDNIANFKRLLSLQEAAQKAKPDILFLGDSITQQWEGKKAWKETWAPLNAFNAGIGGDRTEHILWRLDNKGLDFASSPKVCVLMIGTNNTGHKQTGESAPYTAAGIEAIVKSLHQKYPKMKILLLGIFPRGANPQDRLRLHNEKINLILSGIKAPYLTYLDIAPAFLEADGTLSREISPDLLHFNDTGYQKYTEAILPTVKQLLNR